MILNDVKSFLNINDNLQDAKLNLYIKEAKNYIASIIWNVDFKENQELFDFSWKDKIFLNLWLNLQVQQVFYNSGSTVSNPVYTEITNYRVINKLMLLNQNYKELKIVFSTGWQDDEMPDDIVNAICLFVANKKSFENIDWTIKSETVDWDTITFNYDAKKQSESEINLLLAKYRTYDFSS